MFKSEDSVEFIVGSIASAFGDYIRARHRRNPDEADVNELKDIYRETYKDGIREIESRITPRS